MNFVHAITVVIAGEFAATVVHGDMRKSPARQPGIDRVLISIDHAACLDGGQDVGPNGVLLNVGAELENELPTSLNHA
nr:hypothetical protein [Deinococcus marmoris]